MRVSERGLDLIKEFEGLRLKAYRDIVGILTIGYGHTGPDVTEDLEITKEKADQLLLEDVKHSEACVNRHIQGIAIHQNQFDALVSFVFNLGCGNLHRSTLLKCLLDGDDDAAANQFCRWNRAGGRVSAGLTRRRKAEEDLFRSTV